MEPRDEKLCHQARIRIFYGFCARFRYEASSFAFRPGTFSVMSSSGGTSSSFDIFFMIWFNCFRFDTDTEIMCCDN